MTIHLPPPLPLSAYLPEREYTQEDLDLMCEAYYAEARESFWYFRILTDPTMKQGWFQWEVAWELQRWYEDFMAGKRPVLVFSAPPQHGKSRQIMDFIAWVCGKNPDLRTIFTSYSGNLGVRTNLYLQRLMDSDIYKRIFPNTRLPGDGDRALRNTSMLEFLGRKGSFINTTVEGQINGQGLELGVVDDPLKGRAEAMSKQIRDKTWMWLTDDFFPRFADMAGMLMIMTRWHQDDTTGRWIERFPKTRMLVYPALAIADERYRKAGEPLFPELKSLEFLLQRKQLMSKVGWESVYQQFPIVVGGNVFPIDKFRILPAVQMADVVQTIRYWDKAGTDGGGAYTAGVRMHRMKNKQYIISDVQRGQWSALKREEVIKDTCAIDNSEFEGCNTWVEQEPGSGGLESAENTIRNLAGFTVYKDKVTGNKAFRADPYAAQVQGGNVFLVNAHWNRDFIDEHESWPAGYKDQVDSAGGAFAKCTGPSYNIDNLL